MLAQPCAVPGVVEVVTAADVPVNEYGLVFKDQPVLIGVEHTGRSKVPCDVSRWEADQLCVVVAETKQAAHAGAKQLVAEWEELPLLPDLDAALASSVMLHPENGLETNAYQHLRIRKGDIEAGWAQAEVVVEGHLSGSALQEHAYLQPEAALAYIDDDGPGDSRDRRAVDP